MKTNHSFLPRQGDKPWHHNRTGRKAIKRLEHKRDRRNARLQLEVLADEPAVPEFAQAA